MGERLELAVSLGAAGWSVRLRPGLAAGDYPYRWRWYGVAGLFEIGGAVYESPGVGESRLYEDGTWFEWIGAGVSHETGG